MPVVERSYDKKLRNPRKTSRAKRTKCGTDFDNDSDEVREAATRISLANLHILAFKIGAISPFESEFSQRQDAMSDSLKSPFWDSHVGYRGPRRNRRHGGSGTASRRRRC